jgi:hypothetical protein
MADDSRKPPLVRRVPGAARSAPGSAPAPVLSDALMKRMRAAVDAARATKHDRDDDAAGQTGRRAEQPGAGAEGRARTYTGQLPTGPADSPEPVTEPLPNLQAALAAVVKTSTEENGSRSPVPAGTSAPKFPVQIWPPVQTPPVPSARPAAAAPPAEKAPPARTPAPARTPPPARTPRPARTAPPARKSALDQTVPPAETVRTAKTELLARKARPTRAIKVQARRPMARTIRYRGPRLAGVAAVAVILITAGAAALVSARSAGAPSHSTRPQAPSRAAVAANLAAAWVAKQVGHDQYVACDKVMYDALTAHGFPSRTLQLIRPDSPIQLHAQVVVVTPDVKRQFGGSLGIAKWAPAVLARVGSGAASITIRIVSPRGAAVYESALSADVKLRKAAAGLLLTSSQVKTSAEVRRELADGQVDSRLLVVLTALASVHPIDILAFGKAFPGASPGIPLRTADLADNLAVSGLNRSDYLRYLATVTAKEPIPYRPQTANLASNGAGSQVFRIGFAAPSPLLLLGGQGH